MFVPAVRSYTGSRLVEALTAPAAAKIQATQAAAVDVAATSELEPTVAVAASASLGL